jgi:WhiB family redox-sensing transcriptional regulator
MIEFQRPAWQADAACRGTDPNLWFPERGATLAEARQVCAGCPVRAECLEWALDNNQSLGVWGGLSERARRQMQKARKAVAECGTESGYYHHHRIAHDDPCEACRKAHSEATTRRRGRRTEGYPSGDLYVSRVVVHETLAARIRRLEAGA